MNTSPFLTRSHLTPNLAVTAFTIFISFTVSIHTSTQKQFPPSPLPLFTPSLTTATPSVAICPSLRSPSSNTSRPLLHVLLLKLPNPVTSLPSYGCCYWLKIVKIIGHIEYKILSLTFKVLTTTQPSYLHNVITVQPPRNTHSSSLVTLARPSTSSSLRITDRSFQYASPRLWNQLPTPLCQPRTNLSSSDSPVL